MTHFQATFYWKNYHQTKLCFLTKAFCLINAYAKIIHRHQRNRLIVTGQEGPFLHC